MRTRFRAIALQILSVVFSVTFYAPRKGKRSCYGPVFPMTHCAAGSAAIFEKVMPFENEAVVCGEWWRTQPCANRSQWILPGNSVEYREFSEFCSLTGSICGGFADVFRKAAILELPVLAPLNPEFDDSRLAFSGCFALKHKPDMASVLRWWGKLPRA
jgi:hypothetical protein